MQYARRYFLKVGLIAAVVSLALDQAAKLWLLSAFDIANRGPVHLTPFFDLVLTWNKGISYGWFQTTSASGEMILFGVKIAAVIGLWNLAGPRPVDAGRNRPRIDHRRRHWQRHRPLYLWRGDGFCPVSCRNRWKDRDWYVFNLADVAIVAGVIGLLYDSFVGTTAAKAP